MRAGPEVADRQPATPASNDDLASCWWHQHRSWCITKPVKKNCKRRKLASKINCQQSCKIKKIFKFNQISFYQFKHFFVLILSYKWVIFHFFSKYVTNKILYFTLNCEIMQTSLFWDFLPKEKFDILVVFI